MTGLEGRFESACRKIVLEGRQLAEGSPACAGYYTQAMIDKLLGAQEAMYALAPAANQPALAEILVRVFHEAMVMCRNRLDVRPEDGAAGVKAVL
jgi:hypothetical protein